MNDYIITEQQTGYTIRSTDAFPKVWAYSTLQEALDGLKELYETPVCRKEK